MTEGDGPVIGPKTIPKLAELTSSLAARSRTLRPPGRLPGESRDLVHEVESRDYECDEDETAWLSNPVIWPADTTERLLQLIELCESLAIPYDFDYTHKREDAATVINGIVIKMTGD